MGQNASERAVRNAVLSSTLREFEGYLLASDCGTETCGGERLYDIAELARMYGPGMRVAALIARLRCHRCGARPRSCFIQTGPELARRGRMRRLALMGVMRGDQGR